MPESILRALDQGEVTARNRRVLGNGELQESIGTLYKIGDNRLWKQKGRTLFGTAAGSFPVLGIGRTEFEDTSFSQVLALSNDLIWGADPRETPPATFTPLFVVDPASVGVTLAHSLGRYYLGLGAGKNRVFQGDGTNRDMGMVANPEALVLNNTGSKARIVSPPTTNTGTFVNPENADNDKDTYASGTLDAPGTVTEVWDGFPLIVAGDLLIFVDFEIVSDENPTGSSGSQVGIGGSTELGFDVDFSMKLINDGAPVPGSEVIYEQPFFTEYKERQRIELTLPVDTITTNIQVEAELIYNSGSTPATMRVYQVGIVDPGGSGGDFDAVNIQYALCEYDSINNVRGPYGSFLSVTAAAINFVVLGLPLRANNKTTHFEIYRTPNSIPDEGVIATAPSQLGLVATVPRTESAWRDSFGQPEDVQTTPIVPLITTQASSPDAPALFYPQDSPPPTFTHMNSFQGRLVGVSPTNPFVLYYSVAGLPESWPAVYAIDSFDMPELSRLVASVTVGDTLLIGASDVMFALDSLPDPLLGTFDLTPIRPIADQPGLVSQAAITTFSVEGEPRAAWVSPQGIWQTDTQIGRPLTRDADWKSIVDPGQLNTATLDWDEERDILIFTYFSLKSARRALAFIHMAPEHQKENGNPKITWEHYGNVRSVFPGYVDKDYKTFSGGSVRGDVYVENRSDLDASNAFDGSGTIPLRVTLGRQTRERNSYKTTVVNMLRETAGSDIVVKWTTGFDQPVSERTKTITLNTLDNGERWQQFTVQQAGEWDEVQISHDAAEEISIQVLNQLVVDGRREGPRGTFGS